MNTFSRRSMLKFGLASLPLANSWKGLAVQPPDTGSSPPGSIADVFPRHAPELVRELVIVSHFDLKRVREIVEPHPSLARAAWDWGFGDWESPLGAASHMGNQGIAKYLIEKGARPSLFSATMLGHLEVVRAFVSAQPGVQRIRGPHSISLLAHAKAGGPEARSVYDFLQSLGGADSDPVAPLSENERGELLGTYVFGFAPDEQIDITVEHNPMINADALTWTRKGTFGRPLYHLGNKVFYPAGAAEARIRFAQDQAEMVMTVSNPDLVLTARRRAARR